MDFSFVYLARRFAYRFLAFFRHWYIDAPQAMTQWHMKALRPTKHYVASRVVHAFLTLIFIIIYIIWAAIPVIILYYVARNL